MPKTPLYDALAESGARFAQYCEAETPAAFGEVVSEFRELNSGCAVYDLGWRAKVAVAGKDRVRWLNGMVSNNVKDLPAGRGNYSFVLNAQGRILGDLYTYNRGEYFLIDTDRWQLETLLTLFKRYIIMDKVELSDKSSELVAIGMQGSRSAEVLRKAGITAADLEAMQLADVNWNQIGIALIRMPGDTAIYELWTPAANVVQIWNALLQAGATPVGTEALEKARVMRGVPRYAVDIRDRDLPQETEQTQALNFTKGCYIGQEIVERIRSRGNVHRKFQKFLLEGDIAAPGTKLQANGKEVGELTSVEQIPTDEGNIVVALGYIRREALEQSAKITYPGGEAKLGEVPASLAS